MSFIVTSDEQYYLRVKYCETREDADEIARAFVEEHRYCVGDCRVTVAEVLSTETAIGQPRDPACGHKMVTIVGRSKESPRDTPVKPPRYFQCIKPAGHKGDHLYENENLGQRLGSESEAAGGDAKKSE